MNADETHWESSLCGELHWFVCKTPKGINFPTPVIPTQEPLIPCENTLSRSHSFYYWRGYCYEVDSRLKGWRGAKESCESVQSTLVSIHSSEEVGFLLRLIDKKEINGNRVWIGLNSLNQGIFAWTDKTPVDFTYWNENEPNNHDNKEECASMYKDNGFWNDERCYNDMGYICKYIKDANVSVDIPTTRDPRIGNCKKGWYDHHDRCYLPVGYREKDKLNWEDAFQACQQLGGYLLTIRNAKEQAFISYLMQGLKDDVWIGVHDTFQSGGYYWVDDSDIKYTNWAPGEPSLFRNKEDCVKMSYNEVSSGVWRDDECSKKLPYICKMDKDPDLPVPEYNRGLDCIYPKGWLKLEDMCFKMFAGMWSTREVAEATCERHGAQLISISGTSVQAIATYLSVEINETYWIGLRYEEESQQFSWLNGWPMTISKWGRNEPSQYTENTCFSSTTDGYWNMASCKEELPFICQITTGRAPIPKINTGSCPNTSESWIPTDGSNCHMYGNDETTWSGGYLRCLGYGSDLISIHSLEELEQIRKTMPTGLTLIIIGLMRKWKKGFSWSDDTTVDFVNWEENQPEDNGENPLCVGMMADTLKWRVISCLDEGHRLCSSKKVKEVYRLPERAHFSDDSYPGPNTGVLTGIVVSAILLVLVFVMLGAFLFRRKLTKSCSTNPFRQHRNSYDNAAYNVKSSIMKFQDGVPSDSR